jgi:hypothetical protein
LSARIAEVKAAQEEALAKHEKALKDFRIFRAREARLRQQIDLLDNRAAEALSIEDREKKEAEEDKIPPNLRDPSEGLSLNLSPVT